MVVNGACKDKDMAHFQRYMSELRMDVQMEYLADQQLLALQVSERGRGRKGGRNTYIKTLSCLALHTIFHKAFAFNVVLLCRVKVRGRWCSDWRPP